MPRMYAATINLVTVSGPTDLVEVVAGAAKPLRIVKAVVTQQGTTLDDQLELAWWRTSAVGAGSDVAPVPLDPGDQAASWVLRHTHTTPPTRQDRLYAESVASRAGWSFDPRPDLEVPVPSSGSVVLRLENALSSSSNIIVTVIAEERD